MSRIASLNSISVGALTILGAGMFFYANHTTDAARVVAKPDVIENALIHVPAVSGIDSSAPLVIQIASRTPAPIQSDGMQPDRP